MTTSDNWKGVIPEQCFANEEKALTTFFELFDLFIDNVKSVDTKGIVLDFFDKLVYCVLSKQTVLSLRECSVCSDDIHFENRMRAMAMTQDNCKP